MKTFTLSAAVHKLVPTGAILDREIAERVGQEIINNRLEPGAWATALAASGGKRQDALAAYARIRMRQLSSDGKNRYAKSQSFEARRLTTCLGIKTVQDLLRRSNAGGRVNLARPKPSFIWLMLLMIGSTGTVACAARLLGDMISAKAAHWMLLSAPLAGIAAVFTALALRVVLPKAWIMQAWNTGISLAGTAACFASLYFGTKVVAQTPPAVIEQMVRQAPARLSRALPARQDATPVKVKGTPNPANALAEKDDRE
jgi:hypothetical protein